MTATRLTVIPIDDGTTTNDVFGFVEGGICALSDSLVIVGSLSDYSFAVHLWAVDISGFEPTVGPDTYWYAYQDDWLTPPLADDPAVNDTDVINDFSFVIATGPTTFAVVGTPGTQLPDGRYHVASFFKVNPKTLDITRTAISSMSYDDAFIWFPDEINVDIWGDKVVICSDRGARYLGIASPDGSFELLPIAAGDPADTSPTWSCIAITGDTAVVATIQLFYVLGGSGDAMDWWAIDLNTGATTGHGGMPDLGSDNWALHSTAMPDGRIAYVSAGRYDERISTVGVRTPVVVGILNPVTGSFRRFRIPGAEATYVGWTGGWYSNIRDINAFPDNTLVVSWNESNIYPAYAVIDPDRFEILEQKQFQGIQNDIPANHMFFYQTCLPAQGVVVGVWSSFQVPNSDFGIYLLTDTLTPFGPDMAVDLDRVLSYYPKSRA